MHLKAKEDMLALNGELVQQKMALVKEVRVLNCEVSVLNDKICCLENKAIELAQSFSSQIEK